MYKHTSLQLSAVAALNIGYLPIASKTIVKLSNHKGKLREKTNLVPETNNTKEQQGQREPSVSDGQGAAVLLADAESNVLGLNQVRKASSFYPK